MGVEDDHVDVGDVAERLDRRRAGVARGGPEDGGVLTPPRERVLHEAGEQLHRQILEGQRRSVEEFEQEQVVVELPQRRDRVVAEAGIGGRNHSLEGRLIEVVADEG